MKWPIGSLNEMNRLRLGINSCIVLALVVAAVLAMLTLHPGDRTFTAEFARADGAKVGNAVQIAGIDVGEVTKVKLAGDRIVVTFRVSKDLHLGARTQAEMKLQTLLGGYYMELDPAGSGSLPHGMIPLSQTRVPYTLDNVVSDAGTNLEQLDANKLRESLAAMTDALGSDGKRLGKVLDGVASLTSIATDRQDQMAELISAARQATSVVADNRTELLGLIEGSDQLLAEMVSRRRAIQTLLTRATSLTRTLARIMDQNRKPVQQALTNLRTVVDILKARSASIDRAIVTAAPTLRYIAGATGDGPYIGVRIASPLPDNVLCASGAVKGCS